MDAKRRAMIEHAHREYWAMIHSGRCPQCGKEMTTERRGRCTYAVPCGHKLYSGRPR